MRPSVIIIGSTMLAACGGLAYMHVSRESPETADVTSAMARAPEQLVAAETSAVESEATTATSTAVAPPTASETKTESAAAAAAAHRPTRPDTVEQWIKDTQDSDPKIRAAAIAKLANAPKAQALPALKDVLDTGEPEVDRHIALRSLHSLALRDGDRDSQVRDVMRRAIYHSDNDGVTQTAQSLLDDVEAALTEQQ
ncbi:HEAT repeat domain-containing protein [Steroidobacter cummioxidans]|uniref:HEAT repeat domain-containing protein n=1 Tax=Steroidobacter cummioxidans TaxID=1803913 RepID=UPI00137B1D94|nr:HEAT repeat domain-containing protein [Steroidobacter cummioxidans]